MKQSFCKTCVGVAAGSTTHYVSPSGSDAADGTVAHPFRTLTHCVARAAAGSTCSLAAGNYVEGEKFPIIVERDLTIVGAGADSQLDGTVNLDNISWTKVAQCTYESQPMADLTVWQLWADTVPLTPARFPNAKMSDDSVFDGAPYLVSGRRNGSLLYSTKGGPPHANCSAALAASGCSPLSGQDTCEDCLRSHRTELQRAACWENPCPDQACFSRFMKRFCADDDGAATVVTVNEDGEHAPSIATSNLNLTGTIAVLPLGTMGSLTQGVRVLHHAAGGGSFTYTPPAGTAGKGHSNLPFFFEGSCSLLDAEGEWCYDQHERRLRVWLESCASPSTVEMRGKAHAYLINATRRTRLTLERMSLFGGSLSAPQSDLALNQVQMLYPSANRRVLDEIGDTTAPIVLEANVQRGSLRVTNCTFDWFDAVAPLNRIGDSAFVADTLFSRSAYALGESASLSDGGKSAGLLFEYNTIRTFNSFVGLTPGLRSTVAYNRISGQTPAVDGAGVHVHIQPQNGLLLHRNWAHDLTVKAFRFDRINQPGAEWGVNGTATENVAWRTASACFKGDRHTISRNTIFDSSADATGALFVMMYDPSKPWAIPGENAHTSLDANAADSIFNVSGTLPGHHTHNIADVAISAMLVAPEALDFSPKPGSALDRAGAGAYLNGEPYWVPGVRRLL